MSGVYYNEFDRHAAQWLRNLMDAGEIERGTVDERSIKEIKAGDLAGVRRFHAFAGIGGRDLALRLAGWPRGNEVWTASCPCQPFSTASPNRKGKDDERHLWPVFFGLVRERRPAVVFGEQVSSKAGLDWLDGVFTDLEGAGYACWATDIGAAGINAPHIRQRLYWVADCNTEGLSKPWKSGRVQETIECGTQPSPERACGFGGGIRNAAGDGWNARRAEPGRPERVAEASGADDGIPDDPSDGQPRSQGTRAGWTRVAHDGGEDGWVFDSESAKPRSSDDFCGGQSNAGDAGRADDGLCNSESGKAIPAEPGGFHAQPVGASGGHGPWWPAEVKQWADGTTRRIVPYSVVLANGLSVEVAEGAPDPRILTTDWPGRSTALKGLGNAIVPPLAAEFIRAYLDATDSQH